MKIPRIVLCSFLLMRNSRIFLVEGGLWFLWNGSIEWRLGELLEILLLLELNLEMWRIGVEVEFAYFFILFFFFGIFYLIYFYFLLMYIFISCGFLFEEFIFLRRYKFYIFLYFDLDIII